MSLNHEMSERHEIHLAEMLGGIRHLGSGNQFRTQMDGRHDHREETMAFRWDGKATRSKSVSVSLAMWDKAVQQAHAERPLLALRFYFDDRLRGFLDLMTIRGDDMVELLERSRRLDDLEAALDGQDVSDLLNRIAALEAQVDYMESE